MKIFGFLILAITLIASLFKFAGADLTVNVVTIALLLVLVILFTDLKEFDFWGLRGKKQELINRDKKANTVHKNTPHIYVVKKKE